MADEGASSAAETKETEKLESLEEFFEKFKRDLGQEVVVDNVRTARFDGAFLQVV